MKLKMGKLFLLVFLLLFPGARIFCAESKALPLISREHVRTMTTSVIIPCVPKHFLYIYPLLECLVNQSVIPDEVVIALSEVNNVEPCELDKVETRDWPFTVILVKNDGKCSVGQNRNFAFLRSKGEIIICQDADDLPHSKRIEIVKHFFENYYVDHLMHSGFTDLSGFGEYSEWGNEFEEVKIEEIEAYRPITYEAAISIPRFGMQNGNACYSRAVLGKYRWESNPYPGEDVQLNRLIYQHFSNRVILKSRLMNYRIYLSSFWG